MGTLSTDGRNLLANAIADALDSGDVQFQTSGDVGVATCAFAATAFGAAAAGVVTAAAISDDTNATGGTIEHATLLQSDTTPLVELTCTATGGGGEITLPSLSIGSGDTVSVSSLSLTQSAT